MKKVFIDGSAGTTGLRIYERLQNRRDIELITLSSELRKDREARREALINADIAFLCLPDAAAIEAVELLGNAETVIIDTSTAHRVNPDWVYGFPELIGYDKIRSARRIANPGCHASGFIALIKPLRDAGALAKDAQLSCFSLTGYSGGGKNMIAEYEKEGRGALLSAPRQYALSQEHKHLKEMKELCSLSAAPLFSPIVGDFYSGMEVTVPIFRSQINCGIEEIKNIYKSVYNKGLISYCDESEGGFLSANALSGKDSMLISAFGNEERIILTARFDNLGKGASGSAIQNMNIILSADEAEGLDI